MYGIDTNLGGLFSFAIAIVLPVLAALLTRQSWSDKVKGTVLLVLAFAKMTLYKIGTSSHNIARCARSAGDEPCRYAV